MGYCWPTPEKIVDPYFNVLRVCMFISILSLRKKTRAFRMASRVHLSVYNFCANYVELLLSTFIFCATKYVYDVIRLH